jgi:hypothetical protein
VLDRIDAFGAITRTDSISRGSRAIIDPMVSTAREILDRGEYLMPFAFVGNLTTKEIYLVMLDTVSDEQKENSSLLIRYVAGRVEADFVIMDAWALQRDIVHRCGNPSGPESSRTRGNAQEEASAGLGTRFPGAAVRRGRWGGGAIVHG